MKLIQHSGHHQRKAGTQDQLFRRGELTVMNRNQAMRMMLENSACQGPPLCKCAKPKVTLVKGVDARWRKP